MQEIARQRNASVAQVALNWLRTRPGIASLVIGATKLAQLEDNTAALNWTLSDEGDGDPQQRERKRNHTLLAYLQCRRRSSSGR